MKPLRTCVIVSLAVCLMTAGGGRHCCADDDHGDRDRYERHEKRRDGDDGRGDLAPVDNPIYADRCGACHFAYQPGLLPSASWGSIMRALDDHFGETVELDPASRETIGKYLNDNGADVSPSKLSRKILRSLGNRHPSRITEVPYIQKKHRDIQRDLIVKKVDGSLSNCASCHTTAEDAVYDDDHVVMPW